MNIFEVLGPPSSPPITTLLAIKTAKQIIEQMRNTKTVKLNLPAGTTYGLPI